jgi:hypothetical protein
MTTTKAYVYFHPARCTEWLCRGIQWLWRQQPINIRCAGLSHGVNRLSQIFSAPSASYTLPLAFNYSYNSANQRTHNTLAASEQGRKRTN